MIWFNNKYYFWFKKFDSSNGSLCKCIGNIVCKIFKVECQGWTYDCIFTERIDSDLDENVGDREDGTLKKGGIPPKFRCSGNLVAE